MRLLFTTPAGLGHVHPAVPLARAMAARGNDSIASMPSPDDVAVILESLP